MVERKMLTALSQNGSMVAAISTTLTSGCLSVPCYQVSSSLLQLTLTCSCSDDELVRRMEFVGDHHLCALLKSKIVIWDISRGVVSHTIEVPEEKEALDLAVSSQHLYLLIHSNGKLYVNKYDAETGKCVRKVKCGSGDSSTSCMAVYKDDVVGISHDGKKHFIKLTSLQDGSKLGKCKLKKAASLISSLSFSDDGTLLAVTTTTSVQIFHVSDHSHVRTLHIAETPTNTTLWSKTSQEYRLLVETSHGKNDFIYELKLSPDKAALSSGSSPHTTISYQQNGVASSLVAKAPKVWAVLLQDDRGETRIHETRIQEVEYMDEEGKPLSDVTLAISKPKQDDDTTATTGNKRKSSNNTAILGPGQAGGEALAVVDRPPVAKKFKSNEEEKEEEEGDDEFEVDQVEEEEEDDDAHDESIAQRLQRLKQEMLREEEEDDEVAASPSIDFVGRKATTESLSHLLGQALNSGDDSMLELALTCRDLNILKNTFKELDNALVGTLFTKLTMRLASKPTRADELGLWLRLLLTSGKLTNDSHLRSLRNLLQERVESFPHLLRLEGRLSLLGNAP